MQVDINDLAKAAEYIKKNSLSYTVVMYQTSEKLEISFEDKSARNCIITIYKEDKKQVPQLTINSHLPKVESNG